MAYATIPEAQSFLNNLLDTAAWDAANTSNRTKALEEATNIMDNLNYKEDYPDTTDPFKEACALIAQRLLDGVNMEQEAESISLVSIGISSSRMTKKESSPWIVAGVPSHKAWLKLQPYLKVLTTVNFNRIS